MINRSKIVFLSILIFFISAIVLSSISCNISSGRSSGNKSDDVISLFDSLGIGDVPSFPGSRLDVDLYRNIDNVLGELPKLPDLFSDSIFFTYITRKTPKDVSDFYTEKMTELGWEFIQTYDYGDKGSFSTWQKMTNTGEYVTYGIYAGNFIKDDKTVTLILNGFIISEDETNFDKSNGSREEIFESGQIVYFEEPTPPAGQEILPAKSISMGIEDWKIWLQEGSNEKGTNDVSLADDSQFDNVVRFRRSSDPDDGGAAVVFILIKNVF